MNKTGHHYGFALAILIATTATNATAIAADVEVKASMSATVQTKGPRTGSTGKAFFNIEGKNNGTESSYASFGVVDFRPEKPTAPVSKVKALTLRLTQSVAGFSKDGTLKVALAADTETPIDGENSPLKFDIKTSGGVGDQLKTLTSLAPLKFTKRSTGDPETLTLTPSAEAEPLLRTRLNAGSVIRLVLIPDDDDVAATYFGAGRENTSQRPVLLLDVTP